jgi:hypothetical protein
MIVVLLVVVRLRIRVIRRLNILTRLGERRHILIIRLLVLIRRVGEAALLLLLTQKGAINASFSLRLQLVLLVDVLLLAVKGLKLVHFVLPLPYCVRT